MSNFLSFQVPQVRVSPLLFSAWRQYGQSLTPVWLSFMFRWRLLLFIPRPILLPLWAARVSPLARVWQEYRQEYACGRFPGYKVARKSGCHLANSTQFLLWPDCGILLPLYYTLAYSCQKLYSVS